MRCATATNRSAITAGRPPGCSRAENALADDGAIGSAERAARRAPGVGHRERTDQSHSRFRHQGTYATSRADPDGQRRRPGAIRGRLSTVRPAAGPPATPGRRHQPAAEVMGRHLDDIGDHQRRHRCPHPRRTADHVAAEPVRRASRRRMAATRQSEARPCRAKCCRGCGCCTGATTSPAELAAQLWDLPGWARTGGDCSTKWPPPPTFRADSLRPQPWCAICSPIQCCPTSWCRTDWPGASLRQAYAQFAAELVARRDETELMEAK